MVVSAIECLLDIRRPMKDKPPWTALCQQASVEQDQEKFMALIEEISRLLDEKEARLRSVPPSKSDAE